MGGALFWSMQNCTGALATGDKTGRPPRTMDAHLADLARKHRAMLASLATTIPGAFIVPESLKA
jgi:hypothetical protein